LLFAFGAADVDKLKLFGGRIGVLDEMLGRLSAAGSMSGIMDLTGLFRRVPPPRQS
jgi:hypothetical protein